MQPRYQLELALLRWIHLRRLVPLTDLIHGLDKGGAPRPAPPRQPAPPAAPSVKTTEAARPAPSRDPAPSTSASDPAAPGGLKEALLAEIQKSKKLFYGTVIAQAQRIDVEPGRVILAFGPQHKIFKQQVEQNRPWLEEMAARLAGRPTTVTAVDADGPATVTAKPGDGARGAAAAAAGQTDKQSELKQKAMSEPAVQAMLDVFGGDIKEVEEM